MRFMRMKCAASSNRAGSMGTCGATRQACQRAPMDGRPLASFYAEPALHGMETCAYAECSKPVRNQAVPACSDHLCQLCRMGVGTQSMDDKRCCMGCLHKHDLLNLLSCRLRG